MKIGIVGSGTVGGTLGSAWARAGHEVTFGSRNPASDAIQQLVGRAGGSARSATLPDTVASHDVLLLATQWPDTRAVLAGLGDLTGKVLIDATNPLLPDLSGLEVGNTSSGGEQVAAWAHGARVVKAFNTIGFNIMANSAFAAGKVVLFYCGDDADAKQTVKQLAEDLGFDARDAGPLTRARLLEPFALLWISLAYGQGLGQQIGFQLLQR